MEVIEEISKIEDTVNVIAIAGPYRSGKSYLLNRLADTEQGFRLGHTTKASTKGIWVLCLEHPIRKDEVLLLLDTEGIGDVAKSDDENDNNILSLTTLLTGTFVYNMFGVLDEKLLKKLSFVTKISKQIALCNTLDEDDLRYIPEMAFYFPSFVLCLRDFSLEMDNGETPDDYLEMCLELKNGKGTKVVKYNATRVAILEHFQNRKCFVFDRPAERTKLRRLEELKQSELSEDFVTDTSCFLEYIYKCEPKKLIDGSLLNGRMFSCLAKQYIEAICSGDLPCIDDALTKMCREENTFVVVQTVDWFKEQIKSIGMPLPSDFALKYKRIQKEALKMFKKMAVLDDEHEFQKTAEREMDAFKTTIDEDNNDYIKDVCTKELQKIYDIRIKPKVTKGEYFVPDGYKMYRGDFAGLRDQVKLTLSGADPNLVQKYILEFEERYQKQDGEIFQKAGFYDTQIKLEMQEQHAKLEQEKSELDSQVELRRKEETKEINLYKAELSAQMEQDKRRASENYGKIVSEWKKRERCLENQLKEHADMIAKIRAHESTEGKRTHKPTVGQTVMKTMLNASENYGTIVSEWKKRERCLEDQLKEHDDMIAKIREYESTEGKRTHKPTVGQTVMKTMLNLLPVVGPIATGIYERISSK